MTRAFWSFRDLAFGVALFLPAVLIGALSARFLPVPKAVQELIAQMTMYVVWFILLSVLFRVHYHKPLLESLNWVNHGWLFLAVCGGVALAFGISWLGTTLEAPLVDLPYKDLLTDRRLLLVFALASVLLGPIAEELAFRGFIMPLLAKYMPGIAAAVVTAIPFALLHGPAYHWSWQHLLLVFLAGCVFGIVRSLLDSTLAAAATHSAYNLTLLAGYIANG